MPTPQTQQMPPNPTEKETATGENSESSDSKPILALPAATDENAQKIDVSTGVGTAKMDHLGPVVVNEDGTLARITNWDKMAKIEQENTLRVLGARNKARLAKLRAEGKDVEGGEVPKT